MICIIKIQNVQVESIGPWGMSTEPSPEITGWIIATDVDDARHKADMANEYQLSQELYRMTFTPKPGKYTLPTGHILLVE